MKACHADSGVNNDPQLTSFSGVDTNWEELRGKLRSPLAKEDTSLDEGLLAFFKLFGLYLIFVEMNISNVAALVLTTLECNSHSYMKMPSEAL